MIGHIRVIFGNLGPFETTFALLAEWLEKGSPFVFAVYMEQTMPLNVKTARDFLSLFRSITLLYTLHLCLL